jgi:hypothetical protein
MSQPLYTTVADFGEEATGVRRIAPKRIDEHVNDAVVRLAKGRPGHWWTVSRDEFDQWRGVAVWPGGWALVAFKPDMCAALRALLGQLLEMEDGQ